MIEVTILIAYLVVAGMLVVLSPSMKLRIIVISYFLFLAFLFAGVGGFIDTISRDDPAYFNSIFALLVVEIIVLMLHIPLIFKLSQVGHEKHKIKAAREIFEKDIYHLSDNQLKRHLEHP